MIVQERHSKTNFADANNVVLGWDSGTQCCEDHGWSIALLPCEKLESDAGHGCNLNPYVFDQKFFENFGEVVVFRLIAKNLPDLYLHLHNFHNGYYSHGFTMQRGESMLCQGSI